jgi:hypothetical protein
MAILQISIPTFNRVKEIQYCLDSLLSAIKYIQQNDRPFIGVCVYSNSTNKVSEYNELISAYSSKFINLNIEYFRFKITGFDIGPVSNITLSILKSKGDYTWVLPDDDLARLDSIEVILNTIKKYQPSFIHGGIKNKKIIKYSQTGCQLADNFKKNEVLDVIENEKEIMFLNTKGIQLQEHVYRTELLEPMYTNDNIILSLDFFNPVVYGLLCCKNQRPMIFLTESIGIFRDGDPNSAWRYRWAYLSLVGWQTTVDNLLSAELINREEEDLARSIFSELLYRNYWRPDFLLGLYGSDGLTPFNLYKVYKNLYLKMLIKSPYFFIREVFLNQDIRKRVFGKIKKLMT